MTLIFTAVDQYHLMCGTTTIVLSENNPVLTLSPMIKIDQKHKSLLLEALEELMYKLSLELASLKGQPLTKVRKELTRKQAQIEELQHLISASKA